MRLPLLSCLMCLTLNCLAQEKMNVMIRGDIPVLQQPKDNDCWITVATMLVSWKTQRPLTIDTLVNHLGDPWKLYYEMNKGLPAADQDRFLKQLDLKAEPPANYTIRAYSDFLKMYGPIWITTGDGYFTNHARILIGLKGTGDYGSTQFTLIDPATGKHVEQESLIFLKEFEEEARVANVEGWKELRIQIYHY
jgi:hypothetical protein